MLQFTEQNALHFIVLPFTVFVLHFTSLQYASHCTAQKDFNILPPLHCNALHCIPLYCFSSITSVVVTSCSLGCCKLILTGGTQPGTDKDGPALVTRWIVWRAINNPGFPIRGEGTGQVHPDCVIIQEDTDYGQSYISFQPFTSK